MLLGLTCAANEASNPASRVQRASSMCTQHRSSAIGLPMRSSVAATASRAGCTQRRVVSCNHKQGGQGCANYSVGLCCLPPGLTLRNVKVDFQTMQHRCCMVCKGIPFSVRASSNKLSNATNVASSSLWVDASLHTAFNSSCRACIAKT